MGAFGLLASGSKVGHLILLLVTFTCLLLVTFSILFLDTSSVLRYHRVSLIKQSNSSRTLGLAEADQTCRSVLDANGHLGVQGLKWTVETNPFVSNATLLGASLGNEAKRKDLILEENIRVSASVLRTAINNLHEPSNISLLQRAKCLHCVVVGSGAGLRNAKLGALIDSYPVVIRVNKAPIKGYEDLVGSRTDIRVLYPESSSNDPSMFSNGAAVVVVVPYKGDDFLWAATLANQSLNLSMHFWRRNVPLTLPVEPHNVVLMNPVVTETLFSLLKNTDKFGRSMGQSRATTGIVAVQMALNLCGKVSIAGFGYEPEKPNSYVYYYGAAKNKHQMLIGPHSKSREEMLRQELFKSRLVTNLT